MTKSSWPSFLSNPVIASVALCCVALLSLLLGWLPLSVAGLLVLFIAALAAFYFARNRAAWVKVVLWLPLLPLGLAIALMRPEGFSYPLVFSMNELYPGGKPFDLHLNTAKALAGYAVVIWLLGSAPKQMLVTGRQVFVWPILLAGVVLGVAIPLLGLEWQPKWGLHAVWFLLVNLLVTCVAEESFMRLLVQGPLQRALQRFGAAPAAFIALTVTTVLFAAAHSPQGAHAWAIYLVAGCAYGAAYTLTGRLSAAIATHFLVNAVHYLLLTYPL